MAEKKRLSLCMITKNDERHLSDCLQDLEEVVDEIVIVDIGSKDQTVEVAEQAGAKVYQMEWKNDYSEAKNLCLDHAEGRWVLFLQANETISSEQLQELDCLLNNPNAEGYLLYTGHCPQNNRLFYPAQALRLFRNRKEYRYQYKAFERIPEDILSNIEDSYIQIIQRDDDAFIQENTDLNTLLLERELLEHPEDSYLQYMYGIVLLNQQRYEESTAYFQAALQNVNFEYLFAPRLFKCLGWSFINLQRHTEALAVLEEGIKAFPFYSDLLVLRGELRKQLGQYKEAIRDLESSLKIREQSNFTPSAPEIDTPVILEILGGIHEHVFNYRQALACYRQAYEWDNTNQELADKIDELAKKADSAGTLGNLLKAAAEQISVQEKQGGAKQKIIQRLLQSDDGETARKLMEPGDLQPLSALEYALWAKVCMKKLEEWVGKVRGGAKDAGSAALLTLQAPDKPSKALRDFYHSLGIAGKNTDKTVPKHGVETLTCAEMHMEIGRFYAKAQKKKETLSAYLRALQWEPLHESAQDKLEDFSRENPGIFHTFLEEQEWTLEGSWFHCKQEFIHYIHGLMDFRNQQFAEARKHFCQIAEDKDSYPLASAYIISSLWLAGREEEAESLLDEQGKTAELFSLLFCICKNYVLRRLEEGCRRYPYSELIREEKERVRSS